MQVDSTVQRVVVSTDDIPERERDAFIRDYYGRIQMRLQLEPQAGHELAFKATTVLLPSMACTIGSVAPVIWERTSELLSDANDDVCISWSAGGYRLSRPGCETIETRPGTAAVLALDRPFRAEASDVSWTLAVQVKRSSLSSLVPHLDDIDPAVVDRLRPECRLLFDYLWSIMHQPSVAGLAQTAESHIVDLLALALGTTRDGQHLAMHRGVPAARLDALKAYIAKNLSDPLLSAERAARKLAISDRYIRKLFADSGTSFSDYVTARRLDAVYRRLTDARNGSRRIADLAFEAGFSDASTFYRQFRARYGVTPQEVRPSTISDQGPE